jgi:hypothetical protein
MLPVVYWSRGNRVDWIFPIGTEIHELLMQRYNGKYYVYESRRKIRTKDSWAASILLPFTSQAEFEKAIGYGLGKLPVEDTTLIDTRHRGVGFKVRAANFRLPRVSTVLVESALRDAQFTEVEHREWPVTQGVQDFHIVPRLFTGMHAGATTDSCARCHRDVGLSVDRFDRARDWYGRVRGADAVFSFHPFSRGSISTNGAARTVRFDTQLSSLGIIAPHNRALHTKKDYSTLSASYLARD